LKKKKLCFSKNNQTNDSMHLVFNDPFQPQSVGEERDLTSDALYELVEKCVGDLAIQEVLMYDKTPTKMFLFFVFPKGQVSMKVIDDVCTFFFRHLIDFEIIETQKDIKSTLRLDFSNETDTKLRYIFDCPSACLSSLESLDACTRSFEKRIRTDPQGFPSFFYMNKLIFTNEILPLSELVKKETNTSVRFRYDVFGSIFCEETNYFCNKTKKWQSQRNSTFPSLEEYASFFLSDIKETTIVKTFPTSWQVMHALGNWRKKDFSYYAEVFPFDEVWKIFGHVNREWAFFDKERHCRRYLCFNNENELRRFAMKELPDTIHFGAIYKTPPVKDHPAEFLKKELIFDVDLHDYNTIDAQGRYFRSCCGNDDKKACAYCWQWALYAAQFLQVALTKIYGFKNIRFAFSGRRGFHCFVADEWAMTLTEEQRRTFLSLFSKENALLADIHPVFVEVYERFGHALFIDIKKTFKQRGEDLRGILSLKEGVTDCVVAHTFLLPRFDGNVTKGHRHLIRCPLAIRKETGKIGQFFDPSATPPFNPFL
jgi:hypothetical protein